MPGFLLSQAATVLCVHGGRAQGIAPNPRVLVSGQPTMQRTGPWTVSGCPFTAAEGPMPCVTAEWITASTRVTSGGVPLLLGDSQAVCNPNGTGVVVSVAQERVKAE